jgi:hypothetical protein
MKKLSIYFLTIALLIRGITASGEVSPKIMRGKQLSGNSTTSASVDYSPSTNGLVAYYKLDGSAKDEVSGVNGTWGVSEQYVPGLPAKLRTCDGYTQSGEFNTNYFTLYSSANMLNGETQCSFSVWMYPTNWTGANDYCGYVMNSAAPWLGLWCNYYGGTVGYNQNGKQKDIIGMPYRTWSHICVTWSTGEGPKFYTNGAYKTSMTNLLGGTITNSAANMYLGKYIYFNFIGHMSQVLIYKRALPASEIYFMVKGVPGP